METDTGKDKLNSLKEQLGISTEDESRDAQVQFALNSVFETVLNYCNIEEIPEGLSNTVIRMAMAVYRNEQPGDLNNPMAVKSVSVGDTSTSFADAMTQSFKEGLLNDHKKQLNRYRRVAFR